MGEVLVDENLLAGRTVFLVEDELLIAMDIEANLLDRGATVYGPATRVREGISLTDDMQRPIDVAILDIDLGGEDVFPVAEALRDRGVPFLFHTGHGEAKMLQARFDGAPVFSKPMRVTALLDEVEQLLRRSLGRPT